MKRKKRKKIKNLSTQVNRFAGGDQQRHQPVTNLGNGLIAHFFLFSFRESGRVTGNPSRPARDDILFHLCVSVPCVPCVPCVGNSVAAAAAGNQKHLSALLILFFASSYLLLLFFSFVS